MALHLVEFSAHERTRVAGVVNGRRPDIVVGVFVVGVIDDDRGVTAPVRRRLRSGTDHEWLVMTASDRPQIQVVHLFAVRSEYEPRAIR